MSIMTIFGRPVLLFLCSMLSLYCGHMYFSQSFPGRVFSLSSPMAAQAGNFPVFSAFSPLLSRQYCDISSDYSAWNGKIACLRSQEKAGHRLRACLGRVAWFARERPRRRGRRAPPLSGARVRAGKLREGGWYRGRVAFRPHGWTRGFFLFRRCRPQTGQQHPKKEFYT